MEETIKFMHARVIALDKAVKQYKKDRDIAMSALARLIADQGGYDYSSAAPASLAAHYLNNEITHHNNQLIKYEWSHESAQVQDNKHQG